MPTWTQLPTIGIALFGLFFITGTAQADDASRPNLVLIVADDVGWDDLGAYGHPTIRTPVLDKLAAEGVRFDNAYLTASSCSPSRASLLTGRYPHNTDAEQLHWPLPAEQVTFSEKLREAGYWAGAAGKWHLGEEVKDRFDVVHESVWNVGEEPEDPPGTANWQTLLNERPKDKPFFLWLASWDAHRPFEPNVIEQPYTKEDVRIPSYYPATEHYKEDFALYYDEITRLDTAIGDVVATLKRQGVLDNTLIVFVSDNGRPYARDKCTLYDGGVKTPLIAHWPARIQPAGTSRAIVSSVDVSATLLDAAGVAIPDTIQGRSFLGLLEEPADHFRDYAVSERNWHDFEDHGRTVRTERFRYVRNTYNDLPATPSGDTVYHSTWIELQELHKRGALTEQQSRPFRTPRPAEELYDLETDPNEFNNLAADPGYADVLAEHRRLLADWTEATDDFVPTVRTPDEFNRETGERLPTRIRPRPSKKDMYGKHGAY
ncbi:Arylsulfatase [Planctomycetes bacterium MalM25]|nr:Arylsulfatase [Planctomycetes bacterium MalM25]